MGDIYRMSNWMEIPGVKYGSTVSTLGNWEESNVILWVRKQQKEENFREAFEFS